jgi:hypothetical protein
MEHLYINPCLFKNTEGEVMFQRGEIAHFFLLY